MLFILGKRLLTGIFQMASVSSLMECFFYCASEVFCFAINYRNDLLSENCELIQSGSQENEVVKDERYRIYILIQDNFEVIFVLVIIKIFIVAYIYIFYD